MTRALHKFNGGIHPAQHKRESTANPIAIAPLPLHLVVPFHQHIGNRAKPIVQVGDTVLKGQMIGQADDYVSCAVHAPTSGTVTAIEMATVPHPSGLSDLCITIAPDGAECWVERAPLDYQTMNPDELRNHLRDLGLAGLGGAVFPSHAKLNPGKQPKVPTLILNGAECEPWITCDDMLMRERAAEIVAGAKIMQHMLGSDEVLIGIEDNKPEAIAAMQAACADTSFEVIAVPTIYPGGGAKQLTKVLLGKEPPAGGRSTDIGVQVFNVATCYSLARVVFHGEPLISRIVTVTGNVERPQNFEVLLGTPVEDLVTLAGKPRSDTQGYIMGGPMMGFTLPSNHVPVVKATNCLIASSPKLFPPAPVALPCIRCTQCAQACPVGLQPQDLYWFARGREFGKAQEYDLFDCIECGCCDYVCPSHIPLVQYYRFAKSEIWAREREKNQADVARERHEFRESRIERAEKERAEKLAAKTQGSKTPASGDTDTKQAAIQAAIERAKLKRAGVVPQNVENLPTARLQEIEEIEARRIKLKEAMEKQNETQSD
jgi:electron transport complex protein RnfC